MASSELAAAIRATRQKIAEFRTDAALDSGDAIDAASDLAVLALCETDGNKLRITTQLDRKLYTAVNKALVAAGGKWNTRQQAHLFPGDAGPVLASLLNDGQVETDSDRQFFETPPEVVNQLFDLADLEPDMVALEPSAGRGAIASVLWPHVEFVDCIELHQPYADVIERAGYARNLWVGNFLTMEPQPVYDRVVMNPPFADGMDIRHVRHALRWLAPGGLLVSVMAGGIMFRDERKHRELRGLVDAAGGGFEKLPARAFHSSGTDVDTVVAVIPYPVRLLAVA